MRLRSFKLSSIFFMIAALFSVVSAPISAQTSDSHWNGTFSTNYGDLRLIQSGDRVYGDYGTRGYIEGRVSQNGQVLRGTFQYNSPRGSHGFIEFRRSGSRFEGGWSWTKNGPPSSTKVNWTGTRKSSARPTLKYAVQKASYWSDAWFKMDQQYRTWVSGSNAAITSTNTGQTAAQPRTSPATAAVQPEPAQSDIYPIEGNWSVNVEGAEYGPLAARRMVLQFTDPDSNGLVVGRAPGKPLVMIGRRDGSSGFRGVWMETAGPTNFSTTGRWGGVQASSYRNANGSGIDARFSVGYRLPLKQVSNPAVPGMRARGSHLDGGTGGGWPSARILLNAWDRMVAKPSPYSAIHGIWPTSEINAAIQKWVGNERVVGNFGMTQNVDLCAAKCMEAEPQFIFVNASAKTSTQAGELITELAGKAAINFYRTKTLRSYRGFNTDTARIENLGQRKLFDIDRKNALNNKDTWDSDVFGDNWRTTIKPCDGQALQTRGIGRARFPIPPGLWSDPQQDFTLDLSAALREIDVREKGDETYTIIMKFGFKAELHLGNRSHRIADPASSCLLVRSHGFNNTGSGVNVGGIGLITYVR